MWQHPQAEQEGTQVVCRHVELKAITRNVSLGCTTETQCNFVRVRVRVGVTYIRSTYLKLDPSAILRLTQLAEE